MNAIWSIQRSSSQNLVRADLYVCSLPDMMVASDNHLTRLFFDIGGEILGIGPRSSVDTRVHIFRSNFKYSPSRCAYLYRCIRNHPSLPDGYGPKHLLWTLYFLLTYATERRLCCILKADRKTIRQYTWPTITALASMERHYVSEMTVGMGVCFFSIFLHMTTDVWVTVDSLGEQTHRWQR